MRYRWLHCSWWWTSLFFRDVCGSLWLVSFPCSITCLLYSPSVFCGSWVVSLHSSSLPSCGWYFCLLLTIFFSSGGPRIIFYNFPYPLFFSPQLIVGWKKEKVSINRYYQYTYFLMYIFLIYKLCRGVEVFPLDIALWAIYYEYRSIRTMSVKRTLIDGKRAN